MTSSVLHPPGASAPAGLLRFCQIAERFVYFGFERPGAGVVLVHLGGLVKSLQGSTIMAEMNQRLGLIAPCNGATRVDEQRLGVSFDSPYEIAQGGASVAETVPCLEAAGIVN